MRVFRRLCWNARFAGEQAKLEARLADLDRQYREIEEQIRRKEDAAPDEGPDGAAPGEGQEGDASGEEPDGAAPDEEPDGNFQARIAALERLLTARAAR